jgi:hypothetical protein
MKSKDTSGIIEALPGVTVKDHHGGDGYCAETRMFITVWHDRNEANIRLSPTDQRRYLSIDGEAFEEIHNAWGRQGWTKINLEFIDRKTFESALKSAFEYSGTKSPKLKK